MAKINGAEFPCRLESITKELIAEIKKAGIQGKVTLTLTKEERWEAEGWETSSSVLNVLSESLVRNGLQKTDFSASDYYDGINENTNQIMFVSFYKG